MKFTLAQLRKFNMPYTCEEELDLSSSLNGFENVKTAQNAKVSYVIRERGDETYLIEYKFSIDLILEDSVSLDEIPYSISGEAEEVYTTDSSNEDATVIEGITVNTYEAVLTSILEEKPMSYSTVEFTDQIEEQEEDEDAGINPAFAALKNLL